MKLHQVLRLQHLPFKTTSLTNQFIIKKKNFPHYEITANKTVLVPFAACKVTVEYLSVAFGDANFLKVFTPQSQAVNNENFTKYQQYLIHSSKKETEESIELLRHFNMQLKIEQLRRRLCNSSTKKLKVHY